MASHISSLLLFLLLATLASEQVFAEIVFEDGYAVSTVLDGNKLQINPFSVLPRPGTDGIFILDSSSSVFYTLSFPLSQGSGITRFSGNGTAGFADGNSDSAMFDRPRSFAVDLKGNIYVADKNNRAIRKITKSGVTTIAGGYSKKPGHEDGPARNASFSDNFELAFVPERCALLISDHGNRLIRQINLKSEDCARGSRSLMGVASVWMLGLGISCLVGFVVGFLVRPYLVAREDSRHHCFSETWKHCPINLGRRVLIVCSEARSAIASSPPYTLLSILLSMLIGLSVSHLSLMFRNHRVESQCLGKEPVSLLDSDDTSKHEMTKSQMFADQLKDLISFDGGLDASETMNSTLKQGDGDYNRSDALTYSHGGIDGMIKANIFDFAGQAKQKIQLDASLVGSLGILLLLKK
ncbi:hypothetical protein HHK36_015152 [Tetracentron sinense]|uniref:NHL repeat-containing protein n=1 Tax=Tetracentron sinense TaxID=13715 RepID=A0A835DFX0_TETSI|nr:hypothetical protein HHK36_015152 [Tetracentron sinense]